MLVCLDIAGAYTSVRPGDREGLLRLFLEIGQNADQALMAAWTPDIWAETRYRLLDVPSLSSDNSFFPGALSFRAVLDDLTSDYMHCRARLWCLEDDGGNSGKGTPRVLAEGRVAQQVTTYTETTLTITDSPLDALATEIPKRKITKDVFPTARDIDHAVPLTIGRSYRQPCANITTKISCALANAARAAARRLRVDDCRGIAEGDRLLVGVGAATQEVVIVTAVVLGVTASDGKVAARLTVSRGEASTDAAAHVKGTRIANYDWTFDYLLGEGVSQSVGAFSESNAVSATPAAPRVPAKPLTLTATAGDGQATLTWTATTDARITGWQYRRRRGLQLGAWTDVPSSAAGTRNYTVTGLTNGTLYSFEVRSLVGTLASPSSDRTSVRPAYVPAKPTGLTATAGNGQVTLTWTAATDSRITRWRYGFRSSSDDPFAFAFIPSSNSATRSYTVTRLTNGTAYTFVVTSVAGTSNSPASDSASATPVAATAPTRAPVLTAVNRPSSGNISLTWNAYGDSSITKFQYRNRTNIQGEAAGAWDAWQDFQSGGTGASATTGTTELGIFESRSDFQIRAVNALGNSPASNTITV